MNADLHKSINSIANTPQLSFQIIAQFEKNIFTVEVVFHMGNALLQ